MAWSIALASGWGAQAAYGEEPDERQLESPRAEETLPDSVADAAAVAFGPVDASAGGRKALLPSRQPDAGDGVAPGFGNVWGVLSESERQARAMAEGEGMGRRGSAPGSKAGPVPTMPDDAGLPAGTPSLPTTPRGAGGPAPMQRPDAPRTDKGDGGPVPESRQVQQRALSTLALHAARAMGSDNARMVGLDVIDPAIAVNDGGAIRHAVFQPAAPRGSLADGRGRRSDGAGRGPRHADLVSLRPQRQLASAYDDMIEEVAREHAVAPHLVRAVIKVESNFEPNARSPKGAIGLMQVMPATGRRFGANDLKDPRANLGAGTRYLRWLLNRFDEDLTLAVAAYNAGEGAVEKYGRQVPPYPETRNYVRKVLAHLGMGGSGADAGADARSDTGAGRKTEPGSGTPARVTPGDNARAVRAVDSTVASRKADGTLRRLSGWFGAILTSGSAPAGRQHSGETVQHATWRGPDPADPWMPDEWPADERSAQRAATDKRWRNGKAAARPYTMEWQDADRDDTSSRGPV